MTETLPMPIKAISPWYGSKRTLAPLIVEALGPHKSYFEPFCGSMAVLLAKEPSQYETVCDLHGWLVNLAKVLQQESLAVALYAQLSRTLFCEALLAESRDWLSKNSPVGEADLLSAYHFFIHSWAGRNGTAGSARMNFSLCVRWTPTGGSATTRWRNAIESIPAWHERLRNVVVLHRNAFDSLPSIPDRSDTAIYCDPPYLRSTRGRGECDGGYLHDFSEGGDDDHARLSELLRCFSQSRVVVSYYDSPRLKELYPLDQWTHVVVPTTKNLANQNARDRRVRAEAKEVLIVNGAFVPSEAKAMTLFDA